MLDATMLLGHPSHSHISGSFQILGNDSQDLLCGANLRWEKDWENAYVMARAAVKGKPSLSSGGIMGEILVELQKLEPTAISMVTALEVEACEKKQEDRPSLILRRTGTDSLWEIAKSCGSTVAAIWETNGLESEPSEDQMLLIPVL
jgi:hypothetical protein